MTHDDGDAEHAGCQRRAGDLRRDFIALPHPASTALLAPLCRPRQRRHSCRADLADDRCLRGRDPPPPRARELARRTIGAARRLRRWRTGCSERVCESPGFGQDGILEGEVTLRLGDREIAVGPGDYIALPAGPDHPHQLINRSGSPVRYLCMSTMQYPEIAFYPDSRKIGVTRRRVASPAVRSASSTGSASRCRTTTARMADGGCADAARRRAARQAARRHTCTLDAANDGFLTCAEVDRRFAALRSDG